uniref:Uncharacterized protein n=1 Tax=viral metagenome TaxID=1070528 RepID=A0A6C0KW34_9ZZZZ
MASASKKTHSAQPPTSPKNPSLRSVAYTIPGKNFIFQRRNLAEEDSELFYQQLTSRLLSICRNVVYNIKSEYIAYIHDSQAQLNIKAFAFINKVITGTTYDNKPKTVHFLKLQIVCNSVKNYKFLIALLVELEKVCINIRICKYIIITSPNRGDIVLYHKIGYDYMEKGTLDGVVQEDCCWKKLVFPPLAK